MKEENPMLEGCKLSLTGEIVIVLQRLKRSLERAVFVESLLKTFQK